MPRKKRHTGEVGASVSCGFESDTEFIVRATLGSPLPADMPEKLRDSMVMVVVAEALRTHASQLAKEARGEEWKVETHTHDSSTEQPN